MKAGKGFLMLSAGLLVTASLAKAESVADKKAWANVDEYVTKSQTSAAAADYCGSKIEYKIDKGTFKDEEARKVAGYCAGVLDGIGSLCYSDKDYKAEVVKSIKTVNCHYDASLKNTGSDSKHGTKFKKSGTTLDAYFNKDSSNMADEAGEFLKKNL